MKTVILKEERLGPSPCMFIFLLIKYTPKINPISHPRIIRYGILSQVSKSQAVGATIWGHLYSCHPSSGHANKGNNEKFQASLLFDTQGHMTEHVQLFLRALHGKAVFPICKIPMLLLIDGHAVLSGALSVPHGTGLGAMQSSSLLFLLDRSA